VVAVAVLLLAIGLFSSEQAQDKDRSAAAGAAQATMVAANDAATAVAAVAEATREAVAAATSAVTPTVMAQLTPVAQPTAAAVPPQGQGVGASVAAPVAALLGTWTNIQDHPNGITHVIFTTTPSGIAVHVFGACTPTDCDWGSVTIEGQTLPARAVYRFSFATKSLSISMHPQFPHLLQIVSGSQFTDNSGHKACSAIDYFCAGTARCQGYSAFSP
jgi:hypothetical protein